MSGAAFNYKCFAIASFADELRNEIDSKPTEFSPLTMKVLSDMAAKCNHLGKVAKEIERLYSGDMGEEAFLKRITEINEM